ncbi:MAG: pyridoxal phosphate-dependent aminotransferase, partial [Woeseiaceae bacterium]|nr:pyridoxal phosphate-dependent aminotransferase [Woeseiaceae bacterium]
MSLKRREFIGISLASLAATTRASLGQDAESMQPAAGNTQLSDTTPLTELSGIQRKMNPHFASAASADFARGMTNHFENGVMRMNWADPQRADPPVQDALVSPDIIKATIRALETGKTHYTFPSGLLELRETIARKLQDFNGIKADPEREIIVTPGSDMGLYYAIRVLVSEGDEVLNPDPSYPNNFKDVMLCGATSVSVPLREEDGFDLNIDEFEKRVSNKTKAIVLTHPNNPTTKVYSRESLEKLSKFAIEHDLFVVVDQAFEGAVFDGKEFVTPAALPGMWERTISVFSTSKGLGLSGYRVGYNVACADIMSVMYGSAVNVLGATNTFAQYGAVAGIAEDGPGQRFNAIFDERRKRAFRMLNEVPGVRCQLPESGFMIWVNISRLGTTREIVDYLIRDAQIMVSGGSGYGEQSEGFIRVILGSLATECECFNDA